MKLKTNHIEFQNEINNRGIEYLIHFTPTINLLSIFEQESIISRKRLFEIGEYNDEFEIHDYVDYMDAQRLDNLTDYINLSIQFPNYFLLNVFRKRNSFAHYQWCILKIDPKYIYSDETLFSVCNAASNAAHTIGINGSIEKFRNMFTSSLNIGGKIRNRGGLKNKYTTDVQAEVLVQNSIPLSDIVEVCFENEDTLNSNISAFNIFGFDTSRFKIDSSLFSNNRI